MRRRLTCSLLSLAVVTCVAVPTARAIPRTEVLTRAKAYAEHPWRMTSANAKASCSSKYTSLFVAGDYVGLPYDWGGFMSLFQFDQQIAQGYGAGSQPDDGILSCTAGLDCSAYISRCWGEKHWTTSSLDQISSVIQQSQALAGDVFNKAGKHVAMFSHKLANGDPVYYESAGYNVHVNAYGGWSHVSGAVPLRYRNIEGQSAANPLGTTVNPIPISKLPFTDTRDTRTSPSDMLDGCGAAPSKSESGREYVYKVTLTQPGTLTLSVSDDVGVDIDVHLYTSPNTSDCVARHDSTLSMQVDCGTYYVVADTFRGSKEYAGVYTLRVDFTADGGKSCGAGPPSYKPLGKLGTQCAYPGNSQLPFCNPNVGATTCIYTKTTSFCSKSCKTVSDCGPVFAGGCCADIGTGELYCLPQNLCGASAPDGGVGAVDAAGAGDGANDPSVTPDGGAGDDAHAGAVDGGVQAGDRAAGTADAGGGDGGGCSVARAKPALPTSLLLSLLMLLLVALDRRRRRQ